MASKATFEEAVTNRANERVQNKIRAFLKVLRTALGDLTGTRSLSDGTPPDQYRQILERVLISFNTHEWPQFLWDDERAVVRNDLFGLMDEMQRAVLAKPPDGEDVYTPAEAEAADADT